MAQITNHQRKINRIVGQFKNNPEGKEVVLIKKIVSHEVPKPGQMEQNVIKIDISELNELLGIDEKNLTCTAEPGLTFADLIEVTFKKGLAPLVVPELMGITLGGAVVGCSIEAMSYKVGGFHDNCLEYEVVMGDGRVVVASRTKNKDIFEMMHGTFGTVGLLTKIKFKLIKVKPWVKMEYETFTSLGDYQKVIEEHFQKKDIDFIDGIIFSPIKFVLCKGSFVDKAPYSHKYDWNLVFWRSVGTRKVDYLKTFDYFFRYDAGCHWSGKNYGLENPVIRFLLGKFLLPSTNMLRLSKKITKVLKNRKPDVIVDVFIPAEKWAEFWQFYLKRFNYFPLWVVPYRMKKIYPWMNPAHFRGVDTELLIDLAIYGMEERRGENHYRLMEKELLKLPGIKTLISYNSFSRKEFWQIWDRKNWQTVKNKTDKGNVFGNLYEKMNRG